MEVATRQSFNLVIDEFQEFYNINKSIYSDIQDIWDQYRQKTHMNFVVSGSIYSLMEKIFHNEKEPLFGRADNIIKLSAFSLNVLKKIIKDYHPNIQMMIYWHYTHFPVGFLNTLNYFVITEY